MTLNLRLAHSRDAAEIARMARELIEVGLSGWSWHPVRVARAIRSTTSSVLVASAREHVIGFAIMEFGDATAHLNLLAVAPTHQRCGIGTRMMEWLEDSALVAGIETITLELRAINQPARDFYRTLAFKETGYIAGYYRGIETALRMARDIRRQIPNRIN